VNRESNYFERGGIDDAELRYICVGCRAFLRENGGLCPSCFRSGLIFSRYRRVADELLPPVQGVNAQELARAAGQVFEIAACPGLKLGPNAFVICHGPPGQGKTTLTLRAADSLKPSIFLPLEMGIGPLLSGMLRRLEIISPRISFHEPRSLQEIFRLAESDGLSCLLIDSLSVSTLRPDDVRALARANNVLIWGTLQETKDGRFRGSNEWAHAADVILEVQDMKWTLTKSRYQPAGLKGEVCATVNDTPASSV